MDKPTLIKNLLNNGGYITVVGGKASNFSKEELDNKRLFIVRDGRQELPSNTRYAILLRFTQHQTTTAIMKECRKKQIPFEFMATGEMHRLLNNVFSVEQRKEVAMTPIDREVLTEKTPGKSVTIQPPGTVNKFVKENINLNCKSIADEARRILDLANEAGVKTNFASLAQVISVMRRKVGIRTRKPAIKKSVKVIEETFNAGFNILTIIKDMKAGLELIEEYIKKGATNDKLEQIRKLLG